MSSIEYKHFSVTVLLNGNYRVGRKITAGNPQPGSFELTAEQYKKFMNLSRPCTVWLFPEMTKEDMDALDDRLHYRKSEGNGVPEPKTISIVRYD